MIDRRAAAGQGGADPGGVDGVWVVGQAAQPSGRAGLFARVGLAGAPTPPGGGARRASALGRPRSGRACTTSLE